ncbi:adenosylmethionine decarboxylase [Hydrogenovibrio marinus]|uniref:S-adenosylmethionine decarboxylase proenzyme n=1 Tax=Hydrogenovibrio marinus TaxID=28885 RepID=A0A067A0C2_HYDMR|nr:adenosylmethionine decarboxylase [Hydrogenovibrio marinus]KDN95795.1 S-adenosylmethionine decarboxylase [Hydrogenovibrio marinus]BBN58718.1 S-adenosylmethionine decarboxylase proenzyme [Hydrogenovibrio marinus]
MSPHAENILVTANDHFEVIEKTTVIDDTWPTHDQAVEDQTLDHFICRDGKTFAGTHLIADFWGASRLDDLQLMEQALREGVEKAKATLLHIHLHHFTPNGGISGVAVLAESHISVHSWPERNYAAFDVFMCGDSEPEKAIEVLREAFTPSDVKLDTMLRGEVEKDGE